MKKIVLIVLVCGSLSLKALHEGIKGGYHFTHNGNSCYFLPVNGLPVKTGSVAKPNGIALCLEAFPASASRVMAPVVGDDSFIVKYATAHKKGLQAPYKVEFGF